MSVSQTDRKEIWRKVYEFVATLDPEGFEMMNYGYDPETSAAPPDTEDERAAHRMYQHVLAPADLTGKKVLEIGCGRGGGAVVSKRGSGPAHFYGLDYSANAIAICRRRHGGIEGLSFGVGDAENLPFPAAQFDAVINVESSHCYASRVNFFREVWRVLKTGGDFLYADFFDSPAGFVDELEEMGFQVLVKEDITARVLQSLRRDHSRKEKLFRDLPEPRKGYMGNWAGLIGSPVYEAFRTGQYTYLSYHLRKPSSP